MLARVMTHFLSHPAGVIGLLLNFAGALLLIWFPTAIGAYQPDGTQVIGGWGELPQSDAQRDDWKREAARHRRTYRLAISLLVLGFLLQLIDLLLA